MIDNISATRRAASVLKKAWEAFRPQPGEAFALVFVESYVNPDGTTVKGFEPGYMAGPLRTKGLSKYWLLARLPEGIEFYFHPRFEWDPDGRYLLDLVGYMFSITRLS